MLLRKYSATKPSTRAIRRKGSQLRLDDGDEDAGDASTLESQYSQRLDDDDIEEGQLESSKLYDISTTTPPSLVPSDKSPIVIETGAMTPPQKTPSSYAVTLPASSSSPSLIPTPPPSALSSPAPKTPGNHRRNATAPEQVPAPESSGHIRKVTGHLLSFIGQLSGNGGDGDGSTGLVADDKQQQQSILPGESSDVDKSNAPSPTIPRRHTVHTSHPQAHHVVDLEAQRAREAAGDDGDVVPVHHVRRLTSTLVDILRCVANNSGNIQGGGGAGAGGSHDAVSYHSAGERSSLLDAGSEYSDDRSTAALSAISAQTALLKAQYMPQQEYKGDQVQPFYNDLQDDRYLPTSDKLAGHQCSPSIIASDVDELSPGAADCDASDELFIKDFVRNRNWEQSPWTDSSAIPDKHKKEIRINRIGLLVYIFYLMAFVFYIVVRATKTLGLGPLQAYGIIVLLVEILGGLAMLPYGLCLCARVVNNKASPPDDKGIVSTQLKYHIRVVIPCYKEPLDVIAKTFMAAMYAAIPAGCRKTVYLLDDGRDIDKKCFVHSINSRSAVYISGRKRAKGEMNGKSANINNAMKLIYPEGTDIPLTEVICLFDADQVPNADFFLKMVPLMDGGRDVAMVLSPQTFYNMNINGDIFNHSNVHFWEYTQPGYDALGLISCTGTNFLLRAAAFKEAGWFPEWTLTEDFALGIELKKLGWQCRYVNEYLAIGEAPDEVRNCFQQRSRWSKGHFQVFCSRTRNPVFNPGGKGLNLLMRWMYGSVILSYFSAFLSTPLLMLVPMLTVWAGAFPIVINFWAALSITIYYGATLSLNYYTTSPAHLKSMWFAGVSNNILWWAFLKAMYRSTVGRWIEGTIVFKVTAKGLQRMKDLPIRDIWMSMLWFIAMMVSLIVGLVHFFNGGVVDTPLTISLIYLVYNLIPQYLLLQYAAFNQQRFFNAVCKVCMLLSTAFALFGVVLIWVLYPSSYDYSSTLASSVRFFDTQRIGTLPDSYSVKWRSDAFVKEAAAPVYLASSLPNTGLGFGDLFGPDAMFSYDDPFAYASLDPFSSAGGSGNIFGKRRRNLLQEADDVDDVVGGGGLFGGLFGAAADGEETTAVGDGSPFGATDTTVLAADEVAPPPPPPKKNPPRPAADATAAAALPEEDADPFASASDPFGAASDPFASASDPFGASSDPFASTSDPFAAASNPFGAPTDPFASFGTSGGNGTVSLGTDWDLEGGFMTGMAGGNIKATMPIAFSTATLAWSVMSFPVGFQRAGATNAILDNIRWGADYLMKVHQGGTGEDGTIITRVGDIDTEMMLWYRPEDYKQTRDAYAVNAKSGAADLGGSVAAALAASSMLFSGQGEDAYASSLLEKAKEVYDFAKKSERVHTMGDFNLTLLYNASTFYDDLAWGAGWLYKATKNNDYLMELYDHYSSHLDRESEVSDFKKAYDWDNVFYATNVLMAQESSTQTFHDMSEDFLKNWICANNVANYTQRGRAYNPYSGSLGATANAAMLALAYADVSESEKPKSAHTYRCWALSQMRYMMGDSGRSLVLGQGYDPPKRTQDRSAGCPKSPEVCNRVTGLLSPDPDSNVLNGALVYGTGKSDNFIDERRRTSNWVGIENNAGFTGALAGAALLEEGAWEICLQEFGIVRSNPVCGSFLQI